jgi:hypothetical protein
MFSDEYAWFQENYVGTAAIFAAKTKSMLSSAKEDMIVLSELLLD